MSNHGNDKDTRSVEQIADEVANNVRQSVLEFLNTIRNRTANSPHVLTIDELERYWDVLDSETRKIYTEIIGAELSSLNEQPLIDSKKGNLPKRGWR